MNRCLAAVALIVAAASPAVSAQDGPPTFVPKDGAMVRMLVEDVPALLQKLPGTALGRLLAEPEVDEEFSAYVAQVRRRHARAETVRQAATALGIDPHDEKQTNRFLRLLDVHDCQRVEAVALLPKEGQLRSPTVVLVGCTPKSEGKATRAFESFAQDMASASVTAIPDAKIGGVPAHVFERGPDPARPYPPEFMPLNPWLAHFPGVFVLGEGPPEECGAVAPAPARAPAHASLTLDMRSYLGLIGATGIGEPGLFAVLGEVERLNWRARFEGARILDEVEVTLTPELERAFGRLFDGKARLPAQPMPAGALLQLRVAVDAGVLVDVASQLVPVPEAMRKDLVAALTGGVAIGVAAPARGGMLPRMFVSLGIADAAALDRVLAMLVPGERKHVAYEGVACTVLDIDGMPSGLQSAFCTIDGVLHLAESGTSLRAFLQARKNGGDAMDVGDAPVPPGSGDPLPGFDLRWDEAAMYRAFHDVWLPAWDLLPHELTNGAPSVDGRDMPSPDVVGKHLGGSRAVLRRDGRTVTLQQLGALGGPEAAALAMTWGPITGVRLQQDRETDHLLWEIAKKKLEAVSAALVALDNDKVARPATLGELVVAAKLPDDALLVPCDEFAEDVVMPAGDARKLKSSFRYFPAALAVDSARTAHKVLLVEISTGHYARAALADDGTVLDLWGDYGSRPIEQFK